MKISLVFEEYNLHSCLTYFNLIKSTSLSVHNNLSNKRFVINLLCENEFNTRIHLLGNKMLSVRWEAKREGIILQDV